MCAHNHWHIRTNSSGDPDRSDCSVSNDAKDTFEIKFFLVTGCRCCATGIVVSICSIVNSTIVIIVTDDRVVSAEVITADGRCGDGGRSTADPISRWNLILGLR